MNLRKNDAAAVRKAIADWRQGGMIDTALAQRLDQSIQITRMDWQKLARYAFLVAIICTAISTVSFITDGYLMALLHRLLHMSHAGRCVALFVVAAAIYAAGFRRRRVHPQKVFSNEAVLFFGVLATAAAVVELGEALGDHGADPSLLILLSCAVYAVIGFVFRSSLVWLFALVSLGGWLGAETGYESGWGAYYLGLNYPARFAIFGAGLTAIALGLGRAAWFAPVRDTTRAMGLLYLFLALWIMSIFGNYGDIDSGWQDATHQQLLGWALLFGVAACAALYHGLRYDDGITKGFGLTFLLINLYTRYCEYFWNMLDKAVFFAILAFSFWVLGSKAEKIWNLGRKPDGAA